MKISRPARICFAAAIGFTAWIAPDFTEYMVMVMAAFLFVMVSRGKLKGGTKEQETMRGG